MCSTDWRLSCFAAALHSGAISTFLAEVSGLTGSSRSRGPVFWLPSPAVSPPPSSIGAAPGVCCALAPPFLLSGTRSPKRSGLVAVACPQWEHCVLVLALMLPQMTQAPLSKALSCAIDSADRASPRCARTRCCIRPLASAAWYGSLAHIWHRNSAPGRRRSGRAAPPWLLLPPSAPPAGIGGTGGRAFGPPSAAPGAAPAKVAPCPLVPPPQAPPAELAAAAECG